MLVVLVSTTVLFALSSCHRNDPPAVETDTNRLAADFAAAARPVAGADSPIRIIPAGYSRTAAPTRVIVSLPNSGQLGALETAWRAAAAARRLTFAPRALAQPSAVYALSYGEQTLLLLEAFPVAPLSAGNAAELPVGGAPELAIIVDDLGYDPAAARSIFAIPARISVAVLPNLPDSSTIAEEAHRRGIEVLLHLPMESIAGDDKAEKIELRIGEPAAEVARVMDQMLATVPYATGVNNHQGSRATTDAALMAALAGALRARGLFFIDSRTSPGSRAFDAVRRAGVPAAARNVFLDDDEQPAAIRRQLEHAERLAREQGMCVAIGHPHAVTLDVLSEMLPEVEARGVRLVSASDIARANPAAR